MKLQRIAVWTVVVVVAVAAGFWAGRVAFHNPEDPLAGDTGPLVHVVGPATVGRSLSFSVSAEWEVAPVAVMAGSGVITSVGVADGDLVDAGDTLFSVNLKPTVVAEGSVPMFRSLEFGLIGDDVAQLQIMLADLGRHSGRTDGVFDIATRQSVRQWQEALGTDPSGVVDQAGLVFVEGLPVQVVIPDLLQVGSRVTDGDTVLYAMVGDPTFWIPLAPEQANTVPLTADVRVWYEGGVWEARIDRSMQRPDLAQLHLVLAGRGGGAVCGSVCETWVPPGQRVAFSAEIVVEPEVTGPAVPAAAVVVDAANRTFVRLSDGTMASVKVLGSGNGLVVVEGIEVGASILLPED